MAALKKLLAKDSLTKMEEMAKQQNKSLDDFIGEMAKLFPDQYFHIGGDEVNGKQWGSNPKIQAFMRAHGHKIKAKSRILGTPAVRRTC